MTPARLSDETLREYETTYNPEVQSMASELRTLRARVADTPENVERVAFKIGWLASTDDYLRPYFNASLCREFAKVALAALAGRGD